MYISAEDRFQYCIWLLLDEIYEKILPDTKKHDCVDVLVNRDITLQKCNNPIYRDKAITFLLKNKALKRTEKTGKMTMGTSGTSDFKAYEVHHFRVMSAFHKLHRYYKSIFQNDKASDVYRCGELVLDLMKHTLQFKNNKPYPISPKNKEIIFLIKLYQNMGSIVKYRDIAKATNTRNYRNNMLDDEVNRNVQYLRKDLVNKYLIKTGMTHEDINALISSYTNVGYKLENPT